MEKPYQLDAAEWIAMELCFRISAPMRRPRRARKELCDRDNSVRMSTLWWRIPLQLFELFIVPSIILALEWMYYLFAPSGYVEYPFLKRTAGHVQRMEWIDWTMPVILVIVQACCWIKDPWSTAIVFCPYILQGCRKHIESDIFGKPRTTPTETIAAFGSSSTGPCRFIMDSGASSHFVGNASMLQDIIYFALDQCQLVTLADGFCLPIVGIGTLLFTGLSECGSYTRSYRVPNVRYVRGLAMNVISVGQLDKEHGLCSAFHSEKCEIVEAGRTVIGQAVLVNRLYEVIYLHVPRAGTRSVEATQVSDL